MDIFKKTIKNVKDFFGGENEIISSTTLALEERATSPFYGYFILSWVIINWRIIYSAFFVDGDNIMKDTGLLRNEYLFANVPSFGTATHFLHFLVYPFIATFIIFWILPVVSRIFFRKSIKNQIALKVIELQEMQSEKKAEADVIKTETELIKNKVENEKLVRQAKVEAPEVIWEKEYLKFKKDPSYPSFSEVVKKVYTDGHGLSNIYLKTTMVAFLDLNDLGRVSTLGNNITVTKKGKYFIKRFLEDNPSTLGSEAPEGLSFF